MYVVNRGKAVDNNKVSKLQIFPLYSGLTNAEQTPQHAAGSKYARRVHSVNLDEIEYQRKEDEHHANAHGRRSGESYQSQAASIEESDSPDDTDEPERVGSTRSGN